MPARRARRGGLYRLNRRHDRVGAQQAPAPRGHGHGMLDGRQRAGRIARRRVRAALQSLPAHEADHAAEDPRQPRIPQGGGRDRSCNRRAGAPIGRADGKLETLTALFTAIFPRMREPISRSTIMTRSLLCPDAFLSPLEIDASVMRALAEDLGRAGDITATATIPEDTPARAIVVAREAGVISGLPLVAATFAKLAPEIEIAAHTRDGSAVAAKTALMTVAGPARAVLSAERAALKLIGHLSGVATATHEFVRRVGNSRTRICCTRKTTPGLRALEKYAVRCGGGFNHRFGLDDAILIKDNHIAVAGGIRPVLERAKAAAGHLVKIEIEVDSLAQLQEVIDVGLADVVLIDNFDLPAMRKAVDMVAGRLVIEASGGITLDTAAAIAETGVDYLSSGALTHSVQNLDIGLDIAM